MIYVSLSCCVGVIPAYYESFWTHLNIPTVWMYTVLYSTTVLALQDYTQSVDIIQ